MEAITAEQRWPTEKKSLSFFHVLFVSFQRFRFASDTTTATRVCFSVNSSHFLIYLSATGICCQTRQTAREAEWSVGRFDARRWPDRNVPTANFISVTFLLNFAHLQSLVSSSGRLDRMLREPIRRNNSGNVLFFRRENLPSNASSDGRIRPERFQIKHFFGPWKLQNCWFWRIHYTNEFLRRAKHFLKWKVRWQELTISRKSTFCCWNAIA